MKTYEKCLICFERQASDACEMAGLSADERDRVMREVREKIKSFPLDHPPVEMARGIHLAMRRSSGVEDPYARIKRDSNLACQACMPILTKVKCDVIARDIGFDAGSSILKMFYPEFAVSKSEVMQ